MFFGKKDPFKATQPIFVIYPPANRQRTIKTTDNHTKGPPNLMPATAISGAKVKVKTTILIPQKYFRRRNICCFIFFYVLPSEAPRVLCPFVKGALGAD